MNIQNLMPLLYLVAIVLFVLGIKALGRVKTARRGNTMATLAMLLAIVAVFLGGMEGIEGYVWIIAGLAAGALVGAAAAYLVEMTAMPEMVALFNGSGGAASMLVALAAFIDWEGTLTSADEGSATLLHAGIGLGGGLSVDPRPDVALSLILSVLIGAITLTGSLVAYGKLSERISGNAINFPGQHAINLVLLLVALGGTVAGAFFLEGSGLLLGLVIGLSILALLLGVLLVIPIGGADMPVVISLLNSYSGVAAAMTGFVLQNEVLVISGAMVGAAGLILTNIMCKAMNRSLISVLMGGFGATAAGPSEDARDYKNVTSITGEELAMMLDGISSVIIVPGYGLAVAQAQHAVRELADFLTARDVEVRYAIHPVAGRMPGHMNVLLAEANVPYEQLIEMDEINPDFKSTDLVIVLGANDVVNPSALDDPTSPLAGMPILMSHEASTVVVVKRSLSPGYAGVKNILFERDNCHMLFGDAKKAINEALTELKEAVS
jgi:proton-translocating NAD(P)+ transhydrogenase subunit beta